ncbi:MAG: hypothetical protein ACPGOY_04035 [Rhodospirillaceae bacterium]
MILSETTAPTALSEDMLALVGAADLAQTKALKSETAPLHGAAETLNTNRYYTCISATGAAQSFPHWDCPSAAETASTTPTYGCVSASHIAFSNTFDPSNDCLSAAAMSHTHSMTACGLVSK